MKTETDHVVYCATNKENGMKYIGVSKRFEERQLEHNTMGKGEIGKAIQDLGEDAFEWTIVADELSEKQAYEMEVKMIALFGTKYPNGYNVHKGGNRPRKPLEEELLAEQKEEKPNIDDDCDFFANCRPSSYEPIDEDKRKQKQTEVAISKAMRKLQAFILNPPLSCEEGIHKSIRDEILALSKRTEGFDMKVVSFKIEERLIEEIKECASKLALTQSELIRSAILQFLKEADRVPDFR